MALNFGIVSREEQDHIVNEVAAAVAAGAMQRAYDLAGMGLLRGVHHPTLLNASGLWLQRAGRHADALGYFEQALQFMPGNPTLLSAIGLSLLMLERYDEALSAFDNALAKAPDMAHTHYRRGLVLAQKGNHDEAEKCYEQALKLYPDLAEALASLASICARKNQSDKARQLATRALVLKPGDGIAIIALALIDLGEKQFAEAEKKLRTLLENSALGTQPRATALGMLGDALDGQKRYDEAYQIYVQENAELQNAAQGRFEMRAIDAAHHMIAYFEKTPAEKWTAPDQGAELPDELKDHVFLLGFMRSGTTLLEQVLASNSRIVALEENGLLHGLGERYLTSEEALDQLAAISGDTLEQNRKLYWDRVRKTGLPLAGKIFVDKQPLNTIKLPLIAKLFPKAKILFALRDPRDVVFSCFRRHFRVNSTMYEFLDIGDAANFYAAVMRLGELYQQKMSLNIYTHRYEDIVSDFDTQVKGICDFLGVEWDEAMRSFNKYAPAVDLRSPSATQVRKPLYASALAQWRRYENNLTPILPVLRPWAEKFGYPAE